MENSLLGLNQFAGVSCSGVTNRKSRDKLAVRLRSGEFEGVTLTEKLRFLFGNQ